MADIFVDIGLADQVVLLHLPDKRDSVRAILKNGIIRIHDLPEEEIDANLNYYMTDLDKFKELLILVESKTDSLTSKY